MHDCTRLALLDAAAMDRGLRDLEHLEVQGRLDLCIERLATGHFHEVHRRLWSLPRTFDALNPGLLPFIQVTLWEDSSCSPIVRACINIFNQRSQQGVLVVWDLPTDDPISNMLDGAMDGRVMIIHGY